MIRRRRSRHERSYSAPLVLGAAALAAGGAFTLLARASARQRTRDVDRAAHRALTPPDHHPVRTAGNMVAPIGKWYAYVPAAVGISLALLNAREPKRHGRHIRHRRRSGAAAVTFSGLASVALTELFDRVLPQPPTPPGHPPGKPVFPSGHAFGPLTIGLVASYILGRERLLSPMISLPLALTVPLVAAGSRVVVERHWVSDVAGGMSGGMALAGAVLAAWELLRDG